MLNLSEVELRGSGAAMLLHAVENGKSAQVSWSRDQLRVQFWDTPWQDVPPVAQATFDSLEAAETAVLRQLT